MAKKEKDIRHLSLRINDDLRKEFSYVVKYKGHSMNWVLLKYIKGYVNEFKKEHGEITDEDIEKLD